jgi:hypothetical protein
MRHQNLTSAVLGLSICWGMALSVSATPLSGWVLGTGGGSISEPSAGNLLYSNPTGGSALTASFAPFTLGVGGTMTYSGSYSNSVYAAPSGPGDIQVRFGLYNNNNAELGTVSGNAGWAGYWFGNSAFASSASIYRRSTTGNYWSTTGSAVINPTGAAPGASPLGIYDFSLTISRPNTTDLSLTWSLVNTFDTSGNAVTGGYSFTGSQTDTAPRSFTFNQAMVFPCGGGFTGTVGAFGLDVTVPEPTAGSLLGLGFLVFLMRRRYGQAGSVWSERSRIVVSQPRRSKPLALQFPMI